VNRDYTPFSIERDTQIRKTCEKEGVPFITHSDTLLHEPEEIHKDDKTPYTVFTPYWRKASSFVVRHPQKVSNHTNVNARKSPAIESEDREKRFSELQKKYGTNPHIKAGRAAGLALLKKISRCDDYADKRDIPSLDATTHLSPHLKFGTISVREAYWTIDGTLGSSHGLLRQLYWRDFFTHIAHHFPHVFSGSFHKEYDAIRWITDESHPRVIAWKEGTTGFPIVDAGMRELNTTGNMHNRVRMVVASFLVKDLHVDWRVGERYFAQQLSDYDPCVNNGNWQWAASTGCDAQPYFRIFNPWLQQSRFDPDCTYIKRWVPELSAHSSKEIHALNRQRSLLTPKEYNSPIVDHSIESGQAKAAFASLKKR